MGSRWGRDKNQPGLGQCCSPRAGDALVAVVFSEFVPQLLSQEHTRNSFPFPDALFCFMQDFLRGYEVSDSRLLWAAMPRATWAWSRAGGCRFPLWMAMKTRQITGRESKAPAQHPARSLCNCAVMAIGTGAGIYVPAKCLKQRV